jgi:hypothetical protein
MAWGIPTVNGFNPLQTRRFRRLVGEPDSTTTWVRIEWSKMLNLLAARYVLRSEPTDRPGWRLVHDGPLKLYENPAALPRAFVSFKAMVELKRAIDADVIRRGPADGKEIHVRGRELRGTGRFLPQIPPGPVPARVVSDRGDEVVVSVTVDHPGYLVLADAWYPGWTATVDGKPTDVIRAEYYLRAVEIPAGEHTVVFRYRPASVRIGLYITTAALGLLALLGLISLFWRARIHPPSPDPARVRMAPALRARLLFLVVGLFVLSPVVCWSRWREAGHHLDLDARIWVMPRSTLEGLINGGWHRIPDAPTLARFEPAFTRSPELEALYARLLDRIAERGTDTKPRLARWAAERKKRLGTAPGRDR